MRFEKAQDPVNTIRGLERAFALLQEVSPGIRLVGGLADTYRPVPAQAPVVLPLDWLDRKLGRAIPAEEVRRDSRIARVSGRRDRPARVLRVRAELARHQGRRHQGRSGGRSRAHDRLRFHPARRAAHARARASREPGARVPPPRSRNGRGAGIHRGPQLLVHQRGNGTRLFRRFVARTCRSRTPSRRIRICCAPACCRASGRTSTTTRATSTSSGSSKSAARSILTAKCRISRRPLFAKDDGVSGLFELKRLAECLLPGVSVRPAEATQSYEHPRRTGDVLHGETSVGRLFEFHPSMVEGGRAAVLDLDLARLMQLQPERRAVSTSATFPRERVRSLGARGTTRADRRCAVGAGKIGWRRLARHRVPAGIRARGRGPQPVVSTHGGRE